MWSFTNGDVFEGVFSKGLVNGNGTYTKGKNGERYNGTWRNGRII